MPGCPPDRILSLLMDDGGAESTTKRYLPVELIFYETFTNKNDAQRRERYFKTSKGKTTLRLMLRETLL